MRFELRSLPSESNHWPHYALPFNHASHCVLVFTIIQHVSCDARGGRGVRAVGVATLNAFFRKKQRIHAKSERSKCCGLAISRRGQMYAMIGVELRTHGRFSSNIEDTFAYGSYSSKDYIQLCMYTSNRHVVTSQVLNMTGFALSPRRPSSLSCLHEHQTILTVSEMYEWILTTHCQYNESVYRKEQHASWMIRFRKQYWLYTLLLFQSEEFNTVSLTERNSRSCCHTVYIVTSRWSHLSDIVCHSIEWCAGMVLSTVVFTQSRYRPYSRCQSLKPSLVFLNRASYGRWRNNDVTSQEREVTMMLRHYLPTDAQIYGKFASLAFCSSWPWRE